MSTGVQIHPTAVVDAGARLGENVRIGPFCVIEAQVQIGDGTQVGAYTRIEGPTRIGRNNQIQGHAAIGGPPQDKKHQGEAVELEIGNDNLIREFVTLNRGTALGGGVTRIGHRNWLLAYVHIAHDCQIGNDCVFSNNATLAGHVCIGDHVIMSGFSGVHQFCRIGDHAFIGMGALINGDVPPFLMVAQESYARPRGINAEGLKRRGFDASRIAAIKRAYRALYLGDTRMEAARAVLAEIASESEDVRSMLDFIDRGERPLLR